MRYNRGGKSLITGKIGRLNCIRQHILLPGERLNASIRGNVRLTALRQQSSVYLHAQIDAFAAPLRWYWSDFTDYIKEGVTTSHVIPTLTSASWVANRNDTTNLGIGWITSGFCTWYASHIINCWNEWYRWPEDSKENVLAPSITFFEDQGKACVSLASAATRMHDLPVIATAESEVASATEFDVRTLALVQARFQQAAKTDWTSQDRYKVFIKDVYGARAQGSNEVDQVPIRLRKSASLSVAPHDMYASDGPSLGELMSLSNFKVNHTWSNFVAPEHMIVCYIMLLRFSPILQDGTAPGIYPGDTAYSYFQGDPNIIAHQQPVAVSHREIDGNGDGTVMGYLGAGWQHREGYNHISETVADLNNFPLMHGQAATAASYRDATKVNANAFRSSALRHYFADLDMNCDVDSMIPPAGKSIVSGGIGGKIPGGIHPDGGYLI